MAIDRIGGRGGAGLPVQGTGAAPRAGSTFEVSKPPAGVQGSSPVGTTATALERLRAGQLDVNGYVDVKVEEATRHLTALPGAQLRAIREALRDRIASDPSLVDLVRTATGETPQPRDE